MTSPRRNRLWLGAALAATVIAALWPVEEEAAPVARSPGAQGVAIAMARDTLAQRATSASTAAPFPSTPVAAPTSLPNRSAWSEMAVYRDPFDNSSFVEAPAPPPKPAPTINKPAPPSPAASAAAPAPPALPWTYAGRLIVPGKPDAVLLHDGPRTVPLAVGDTLGDWRLEADRGAQIDFTHLTTGAAVVLPTSP